MGHTNPINSKKTMGLITLTAMVVGNMIGAGIFLLPSSLAKIGSISLLSWIITGAGAVALAMVFSYSSARMQGFGGPYLYIRQAFGEFAGFIAAFGYWLGWCGAGTGIAVALVGYLGQLWPYVNDQSLLYHPSLAFLCKAGVIWFVTVVNIMGLRAAGMVQVITTLMKLIPILLITLVGLIHFNADNLIPYNLTGESHWSAINTAASLTLWAFIGIESATVVAGVANNPKMVRLATVFGTLLTSLIYIMASLAVMGVVSNASLQVSGSPYAEAASSLFGPYSANLVAIGAIISALGALNGGILVQVRVAHVAAKDGLFFKLFSVMNRNDNPYLGFIISALAMSALLFLTLEKSLVNQFKFIVSLSSFSFLITYFLCAMAEMLFLRQQYARGLEACRSLMIPFLMTVVAGFYTFWALAGTDSAIVFYSALFVFASFPVYIWLKK